MPKVVDHEERRNEVIQGLWAVISERGIEGVTYARVAAAARISVGRIQHYFESKDELVVAGCQAMVDEALRPTGDDPWQVLFELLTSPIPQASAFRLGAAVWYAYMAHGVVNAEIGAIVAQASRVQVARAEELLNSGHVPTNSSPRTAARLVGLSNGLTQRVLIGVMPAYEALGLISEEVDVLRLTFGEGR